MDEIEEKKKELETLKNSNEGDKSGVLKNIDDANLAAKRLEEANTEKERLQGIEAEIMQRKALGGTAEAGGEEKPHVETDEEYTKKFQDGEVNPFKEDA